MFWLVFGAVLSALLAWALIGPWVERVSEDLVPAVYCSPTEQAVGCGADDF
jgi:hypothetical protein